MLRNVTPRLARCLSTVSPTAASRSRVHAKPPEEVDVIVVGCGSAGLVAGAKLANDGLKVACFDGTQLGLLAHVRSTLRRRRLCNTVYSRQARREVQL
mmetsp:Transcript_45767/g.99124  ORF Transcript_45767/g.99124 Transcript_45767/m.99124 type:complete len:98 (+) Transcript_45767:1-294(+)